MSKIKHPFVSESMDLFDGLTEEEKSRVIFIHMNHTNPLLIDGSAQQQEVRNGGDLRSQPKECGYHCSAKGTATMTDRTRLSHHRRNPFELTRPLLRQLLLLLPWHRPSLLPAASDASSIASPAASSISSYRRICRRIIHRVACGIHSLIAIAVACASIASPARVHGFARRFFYGINGIRYRIRCVATRLTADRQTEPDSRVR